MMGLTPLQDQCYRFLRRYVAEHGFAPSLAEIRDHLNHRSRSGAQRLLCALEERGLIRRIARRPRAIELIDESKQTSPICPHCRKDTRQPRRVVVPIKVEARPAGALLKQQPSGIAVSRARLMAGR